MEHVRASGGNKAPEEEGKGAGGQEGRERETEGGVVRTEEEKLRRAAGFFEWDDRNPTFQETKNG